MGDVGSAFLGYSFAVLPLLLAQPAVGSRLRGIAPVLGVLVVWPFVFDAAYTFLRRLARRENVLAAHRSHVYQRLVIGGHSHRRVTTLYIALAGAGAVAAVLLVWRLETLHAWAAVPVFAVGAVGHVLLGRQPRGGAKPGGRGSAGRRAVWQL